MTWLAIRIPWCVSCLGAKAAHIIWFGFDQKDHGWVKKMLCHNIDSACWGKKKKEYEDFATGPHLTLRSPDQTSTVYIMCCDKTSQQEDFLMFFFFSCDPHSFLLSCYVTADELGSLRKRSLFFKKTCLCTTGLFLFMCRYISTLHCIFWMVKRIFKVWYLPALFHKLIVFPDVLSAPFPLPFPPFTATVFVVRDNGFLSMTEGEGEI